VLLAGYQYSHYAETIILGSQDVTIVTSLIVSNVCGHQMEFHLLYANDKINHQIPVGSHSNKNNYMTGACTMLTDQRGPVDSTEATSVT